MRPARHRLLDVVIPGLAAIAFIGLWEGAVRIAHTPTYVLPAPSVIVATLIRDHNLLIASLLFTLRITLAALGAAAIGGGLLAIASAESRALARILFPFAVVLQVTPVVAIAPLIIIWVNSPLAALLLCAWIVAFFPILANTTQGLNSIDPNLQALFTLYGASRWQTLWYLRLPSTLPYFLTGLRISGGLALIGAIVGEFVSASGGQETGLAYRIMEAGYRLDIARMFAALLLISLTGIAIFVVLSGVSWLLLRNWHDSATKEES